MGASLPLRGLADLQCARGNGARHLVPGPVHPDLAAVIGPHFAPQRRMSTRTIVNGIVARLKRNMFELVKEARSGRPGKDGLVHVTYTAEAHQVVAHFDPERDAFVRLMAVPLMKLPEHEKPVIYDIRPPDGELWGLFTSPSSNGSAGITAPPRD